MPDVITNRNLIFIEGVLSVENIGLILACFSRKIPILIFPKMAENQLTSLIQKYRPRYVFKKKDKDLKIKSKSVSLFNDKYLLINIDSLATKIAKNLALILLTSGSTSHPKGCKFSYENILVSCNQVKDALSVNEFDNHITTLDCSYIYGLSNVLTHIYSGANVFLYDGSVVENSFFEILNQVENCNFGAVPTQYTILKRLINKVNLKNLKFVTQAGGRLSSEDVQFFYNIFKKHSINFFLMYGQTEASPRISVNRLDYDNPNFTSVGYVVKGGRVDIQSDDPEAGGEIWYRGKNIFGGYAETYEDLANLSSIDCLKTGDLGIIGNNAELYIIGRKKRMIKINGIRFNLSVLESELSTLIGTVALVSKKDDYMTGFVEREPNASVVARFYKKYKIKKNNFKLIILDKIPTLSNGKVDYSRLNESS